MRIIIKGGVWKNSEDEILKAAVMKYGKNQWARVASLLNRKSSKQCKARWYEWLDPSVKKIEWTREEEEKLLHMAKLMPNQWRTIAPIVGRTAAQCIEHYERLLDRASEQAEGEEGSSEDARRLRPGDIDPAPETKPARPDPIDMDDDEKEMLSEARARLANTQGKKEKRKARERQLEESRRMAMLQKRRELKAAGIESKLGGNKRKVGIDYANEIPFQRAVPLGFYDVSEENDASRSGPKLDPKAHALEVAELEGRREKEEEERRRAHDQKKYKSMLRDNLPQVLERISEQNDPSAFRRRTALSLPSPQVSDAELEEIVKGGGQNLLMLPPSGVPSGFGGSSSSSSSSSSGRGNSNVGPVRTPMREDALLVEARAQSAMRSLPSVLTAASEEGGGAFNGDLPDLYAGTGFSSVAPKTPVVQTPNTLLGGAERHISSNSSVRSGMRSVMSAVPVRDQLGLNEAAADDFDTFSDMGSVSGSSRGGSRYSRGGQGYGLGLPSLVSQLKSLPEPEYTIELSIPELDGDDGQMDTGKRGTAAEVEDAADRAVRERREREYLEEVERNKRSTVLKKGLPRPSGMLTSSQLRSLLEPEDSANAVAAAANLVKYEMADLIEHDEFKYPVVSKAASGPQSRPMELEDFTDAELAAATQMILEEVGSSNSSNYNNNSSSSSNNNSHSHESQENEMDEEERRRFEDFRSAWLEVHQKVMFIPNKESGGSFGVPENKSQHLSALATNFNAIKSKFDKDLKKNGKMETKLDLVTKGYVNRSVKLLETINESYSTLSKLSNDLASSQAMFSMERRMAPLRLRAAELELSAACEREKQLQGQFALLAGLMKSN